MYICDKCESIFEMPQEVKEIHYELDTKDVERYYCCPHCQCMDFTECVICSVCDEPIPLGDRADYLEFGNGDIVCNECLREYCADEISKGVM